jgi:hypothetical protein
LFSMESDIDRLQAILRTDAIILSLLDLTSKPQTDIAKRIIKRSKWDDLVNSEKRLCIYPTPTRATRSESLFEEIIEIDCHVPASLDYMARRTIDRVVNLMNNTRINGRYLKFKGSLGELATMSGFYCCGCRFSYYDPI